MSDAMDLAEMVEGLKGLSREERYDFHPVMDFTEEMHAVMDELDEFNKQWSKICAAARASGNDRMTLADILVRQRRESADACLKKLGAEAVMSDPKLMEEHDTDDNIHGTSLDTKERKINFLTLKVPE